ncbi:MAG: MarR family transcriptional regulator [Kutzneria sp.]|nr:MarR family transcriptional regulator [Kutzneria sp.]
MSDPTEEKPVLPVSPEELARFAAINRDSSAVTVMFHARIAEKLGLSATDLKCLDLAFRGGGPLTAGRIAELSGLSTGAVTGVIDRLERAGYVRRVRDPHDRRKVLVEITANDPDRIAALFRGLGEAGGEVLARYTPQQRKVIYDYTVEMIEAVRRETARIADDPDI